MEATDVKHLRVLDLLPDALLLQVLDLVVIGSRKISAHGAVVARNDDTTAASRCLLVVQVLGLDARLLGNLLQRLAVLVLADAANIYGRVGRQHVLCTSRRVLCCSAGDEHGLVVLEQVFVETHVLLGIGENGIVGFEAVLVEQCLVAVHLGVSISSLRYSHRQI